MGRKQKNEEETDAQEQSMESTPAGEQAGEGTDGNGASETSGSAEVERLRAELAEMKDRYVRSLADMDNVRRRANQSAEDARKFANERIFTELLPVLDNFGRALEAAQQTEDFTALKSGVDLIYRQLGDALTRSGLEKIEAVGQPFDPNFHEALMQVEPGEGQEPNQVVEELRPGYKLHDRVIRPSLVKVTSQ